MQEGRNAAACDGGILNTRSAFLPLNDREKSKLKKLKADERERLSLEQEAKREEWAAKHIERLTARGMCEAEARGQVDRWIDWQELSGDFPLPFDDPSIAGTIVADVLVAPHKHTDETPPP